MRVPGGFFEVTGKMQELDRIMDGIYENSGRMTSNESFTLDLWLEMKDEWFRLHDAEVRAGFADEMIDFEDTEGLTRYEWAELRDAIDHIQSASLFQDAVNPEALRVVINIALRVAGGKPE